MQSPPGKSVQPTRIRQPHAAPAASPGPRPLQNSELRPREPSRALVLASARRPPGSCPLTVERAYESRCGGAQPPATGHVVDIMNSEPSAGAWWLNIPTTTTCSASLYAHSRVREAVAPSPAPSPQPARRRFHVHVHVYVTVGGVRSRTVL